MKIYTLTILFSLAVFSACSGTATNSTGSNSSDANGAGGSTANSISNSAMSSANASGSNADMANATGSTTAAPSGFMSDAAKGGIAEVEMSKLAMSKAQNAEIRKFASTMLNDHINANDQLNALAMKRNVTLPGEVSAEHKKTIDELSKLSGAEFDKKYADAMIKDHEKDVSLFRTQSKSETDAEAKAFAAKTLPTLESHLKMIKDIRGKLK